MKIFVDSNILIFAAVWPNSVPARALAKALMPPNVAMICQQNLNEMVDTFYDKFRDRLNLLGNFLSDALPAILFVPIPPEITPSEGRIRDVKDRPILRAAIFAGADILLTGDKDFLESGITSPHIMNASEFLDIT